jgi:hypothetical protein
MDLMAIQARSQSDLSVRKNKLVKRTGMGFADGACSGYLTYYNQYQIRPLTDLDVYAFIAQNIMDAQGTDAFNAGYCTGWVKALLEVG